MALFHPIDRELRDQRSGCLGYYVGLTSILVAHIDTGITNHADLSGRTVPGYDFINDSLVADDGGGRDSDPCEPGD